MRRLAADALFHLSVAGLVAAVFWLAGGEPWRPLAEAMGRLSEATGLHR